MEDTNSQEVEKKEDDIAAFLQSRGYDGAVPIHTALLIESLSPTPLLGVDENE